MALGGTITELQQRMIPAEFNIWAAYRRKYGPMNDVRRFDGPAGIIASLISRAHGGKAKPLDFMPYGITPAPEEEPVGMTDDQILKAFGKGAQVGKRR